MTPPKKPSQDRRRRPPDAPARSGRHTEDRVLGWRSATRAVALAMAIAAEPAWLGGEWVALVGSAIMFLIALGATPSDLVEVLRTRRP
jgi:hypothetical protein